jgi:hypothetical protein
MLDFPAERGIAADVEMIAIQDIASIYARSNLLEARPCWATLTGDSQTIVGDSR